MGLSGRLAGGLVGCGLGVGIVVLRFARWGEMAHDFAPKRSCASSCQLSSSMPDSRRSLVTERPKVIKGAPRGRGLVTQLVSS